MPQSAFPRGGRVELALNFCDVQAGLLKTKFQEAIQNYQQVEQRQRNAQKQRMERQYRIGKTLYFPRNDLAGAQPRSQSTRMRLRKKFVLL